MFRLIPFPFRFSFKAKLIVSLSAVILVIFALSGYISYRIYFQLFEEQISKQFHKANEQALARLELQIQNIYRNSNYIVFHPYVQEIMERSSSRTNSAFEDYADMRDLNELLYKVKLDEPWLSALYLYDLNGKLVYYSSNLSVDKLSPSVYRDIAKSLEHTEGETVWEQMPLASSIEAAGKRHSIEASRVMKTTHLERYGVLVLVFDQKLFSTFFEELTGGQDSQVYLFDSIDRLLYTDDSSGSIDAQALLAEGETNIRLAGDAPYLYSKNVSDAISFSLVSRVSLEEVRKKNEDIFKIFVLSAIVGIMLTWILVMLTSQKLLQPLTALFQGMRKLREGKFDTRIDVMTKDELGFIGQSFNLMAGNIDSLIKEVYIRQLNEREAELKALQAQLNPHFLYNTLDTIYWSVYLKDDMETAKLVVALSQLLRYALEPVHEETPLSNEIAQIENYLLIQKTRFGNDLRTVISVDDEVRNCLVIRFIMQPLAENVFIHAFRDKQFDRKIEIYAFRQDGKLIIEINDNGCGMDEETVSRLQQPEQRTAAESGAKPSIGIQSVRRRIDLIYGQEYGLLIRSKPGAGTTMQLVLPLHMRADYEEGKLTDEEISRIDR